MGSYEKIKKLTESAGKHAQWSTEALQKALKKNDATLVKAQLWGKDDFAAIAKGSGKTPVVCKHKKGAYFDD